MIKQRLLTNWHFMRVIRLILSVWILVMAVPAHDWLMGSFGAFFLYTALTGVGCCGPAGCYVQQNKASAKNINDVEYEEVK
ncbi:MAG: hypothetical protein JST50_21180 [Bacteroidetes bacterium]|nr:hypothetical protein [Bacteroidota bacterium]